MMLTIPRRASATGDHGFPIFQSPKIRIAVDGQPTRECVSYNIDEGWIEILAHDENGDYLLDPKYAGRLAIERRHGAVRVWIAP